MLFIVYIHIYVLYIYDFIYKCNIYVISIIFGFIFMSYKHYIFISFSSVKHNSIKQGHFFPIHHCITSDWNSACYVICQMNVSMLKYYGKYEAPLLVKDLKLSRITCHKAIKEQVSLSKVKFWDWSLTNTVLSDFKNQRYIQSIKSTVIKRIAFLHMMTS